jgi:MFS family permease
MEIKNIPLFLQTIWSTGVNLVSRILPAYFAKVASATQISLIYSLYSGAKFFAIPCGWLSDKIGKRKTLFLVFLISPFLAISFTISKSVFFFALMGFLLGILTNFYSSSINAVITIFFEQKKTESLFKLESTYQLGAFLGPIIGGFLTLKYGIDSAFYTWAGLLVFGAILSFFLFKKEFPEAKELEKPSLKLLFSQIKNKKLDFLVFIICGGFLTSFFESMTSLSLPLYVTKIGFDILKVELVIGAGCLISTFGLFLLGKRFEKFNKTHSLILTMLFIGISAISIIFVHNLLGIAFLFGIFTIGRAGGLNITRSFISENLEESIRATGMSINETTNFIAGFLGPLFAGILADKLAVEASFISISFITLCTIFLLLIYSKINGKKFN